MTTSRTAGRLDQPTRAKLKTVFADRLRKAIISRGLSHSEFARAVSVRLGKHFGRDSVYQYISALSLPNAERLAAMAEVLGLKDSDLLPNDFSGTRHAGRDTRISISDATDTGHTYIQIAGTVPRDKAALLVSLFFEAASSGDQHCDAEIEKFSS